MKSKLRKSLKCHALKLLNKGLTIDGISTFDKGIEIFIGEGSSIHIGSGVRTFRNVRIGAVNGGHISIGNNSVFNRNCTIASMESVSIGEHCAFGPNVGVFDHDHNYNADGLASGFKTDSIVIENNCWLGANVVVLRGSHIGEGCIITAGTTIKGNIPAHSLVKSGGELIIQPIGQ